MASGYWPTCVWEIVRTTHPLRVPRLRHRVEHVGQQWPPASPSPTGARRQVAKKEVQRTFPADVEAWTTIPSPRVPNPHAFRQASKGPNPPSHGRDTSAPATYDPARHFSRRMDGRWPSQLRCTSSR